MHCARQVHPDANHNTQVQGVTPRHYRNTDACLNATCPQVAMVGSGAWACAAVHIVAQNCAEFDPADEFVDDVRMWVFEEQYEVSRGL